MIDLISLDLYLRRENEFAFGMDMAHEAPFTPPLKIERSYKRGNGGKIIANNEYSTEFRTKYFLYSNARYAALKAGQTKDFGWYVLLQKMWPEWLKEGLTEIYPIPMRMELYYLLRAGSAKHLEPKQPNGSSAKGTHPLHSACIARTPFRIHTSD